MKIAGALMSCLPTDPLAQQLLAQGVPVVRIGNLPHPDDPRMPAIIPDQVASGRLAADHFAQRGFVRLGFVGYSPWRGREMLYEGFRTRAEELHCQCHLLSLNEDEMHSQATAGRDFYDVHMQHVRDWWNTLPRPLGLLASGDMAANRYCQWAIEAGLSVPEDIAVLGVGNFPLTAEGAIVPLSSIDTNEPGMVDTAIDTLRRLIDGETLETSTIMVPPRVVVTRRSTDVLAATDPHVVKALRYMWDHVTENLSVEQIAEHVEVSRRKLERAFEHDLGRGINAELQRRRLERACELLCRTEWPIQDIAKFLKYSSNKYFGDIFRSNYGISPRQYRRNRQSHG